MDIAGRYPNSNLLTNDKFESLLSEVLEDELHTAIPRGVFGEVISVPIVPNIQINFAYGINQDLLDLISVGTGNYAVNSVNGMGHIYTEAASGIMSLLSKEHVRYRAGQGFLARFTCIFDTAENHSGTGAESTVGLHNDNSEIVVGMDSGGAFVRIVRDIGDATTVQLTDTPSWYDPTKANVYAIEMAWLGFGMIILKVLLPSSNNWHDLYVHNTVGGTRTSVVLPHFHYLAKVDNGTGGELSMLMGSTSCFIEGVPNYTVSTVTRSLPTTATFSGWGLIITVRSKTMFKGKQNMLDAFLTSLSIGVEGTKPVILYLYRDIIFTNSPTWNDVNATTSSLEYSVNATSDSDPAIHSGLLLNSWSLSKEGSLNERFDFITDHIRISHNETLTFAVNCQTSTDMNLNIVFTEDT